jgi:hypothetical protein
LTGICIDFDVLSTHCFGCQHAPSKDDTDEDGNNLYEKWFTIHDPFCSINFEGFPQAMEQQLGLHLWERSIKLHDLRYTGYIGDGDTHTCDAINQREVYGPDIRVTKVHCMGTALRDYVQNTPASRLPDKGWFLKEIVPKLQSYYGAAIKNNTPLLMTCTMRYGLPGTTCQVLTTSHVMIHVRKEIILGVFTKELLPREKLSLGMSIMIICQKSLQKV